MIKAVEDLWQYALKLRGGELFRFERAYYSGGDFVTLQLNDEDGGQHGLELKHGVDVRIDDIRWCADLLPIANELPIHDAGQMTNLGH